MIRFSTLRRLLCLLLALLMLTGCASGGKQPEETTAPVTEPTETEPPAPTAPPDGNPDDVTCQGSYTGDVSATTVVATAGGQNLTAGELRILYSMEVSAWRAAGTEPAPDWNQGLDTQLCPLETEATTWQQYFLLRALNTWHTCQALIAHSATAQMVLDPEYAPYPNNYDIYMEETMPCMAYLYGYDPSYKVNSLHQAYIDALPQLLEDLGGAASLAAGLGSGAEQLLAVAQLVNYAYAYFTFAHDYLGVTEEAVQIQAGEYADETGYSVTFRHILVIPEGDSEAAWQAAESDAHTLVDVDFAKSRHRSEGNFADIANAKSHDEGTKLCGGLYEDVLPGQMAAPLDEWLFDEARAYGDIAVLRSETGYHVMYFCSTEKLSVTHARQTLLQRGDAALVAEALEQLPMEVSYNAIALPETPTEGALAVTDVLYPDIAHERITDVPLHLQQDYPGANYGAYTLAGWGCGITTLAMMASYMSDTWLTPPVLADRYGHYCYRSGTDAMLLNDSAPELGFFIEYVSNDWREVRDSMRDDDRMAIVLQHRGYFTRGGHYLVLRDINEDETVSIRDSNLYNYGKLHPHKDDRFSWNQIIASGVQYWVYQPKITRIPACHRCGGETGMAAPEGLLQSSYTCPKCVEALTRYEDFLALCPGV